MIYDVARVRRSSTKFQVDTCKIEKDRSPHEQLGQAIIYSMTRVRRISTKFQVDTCKIVEIQAMIFNTARVRRLSTKFQVNTCKTKKKDRSVHAQLLTL